jgi:5S rRNA maturation endonuclease (ribonuclease M5)
MFQDFFGTYKQFACCPNLRTVDLVGGIHKTVASLHLESWRNEMNEEIQRINQILPSTDPDDKTDAIRQWIQSVLDKIEHYKSEHRAILREATTRLELALWDVKLDKDKEGKHSMEEATAGKAKIDVEEARKEARITSGADIVIKNVLPFLMLVE